MSFSRTVETYVDIDAPPQQVWDVLVDFPTWQDWNPFIPKVDGFVGVGQTLPITVPPPGRKPSRFPPVFGISGMYHAEQPATGQHVTGEDPLDLRDQVKAAEARHAWHTAR